MAKKPSYIGKLNAIANGERGGYELFKAWSGATKDNKLRPVLEKIAVREAEHSWAFEKRLCELGYTLQPETSKQVAKLKKLLRSSVSDTAKFQAFGIGVESADKAAQAQQDQLLMLLADKTIDPQTGELLGRFICEERDSGRLLTNAYKAVKGSKAKGKKAPKRKAA